MSQPVNTFEQLQQGRPTGPLVQGYEVIIGFETHAQLSTASNVDNLAPAFLAEMTRRYAGSVLGRQELLGEIVDDSSESLWRRSWIEDKRIERAPEMRRVVVALSLWHVRLPSPARRAA